VGVRYAGIFLLSVVLGACDQFPLTSQSSTRIPSRIALDVQSTSLYSGEKTRLSWSLYDQNDQKYEHLPGWIQPEWSSNSSIVRFSGNNVEAVASGEATISLRFDHLSSSAKVRINPGALEVHIAAAYITQGIQRTNGTVPLVAGRNGYLRVFVTGDQLNYFRPVVRARFYRAGAEIATLSSQLVAEGIPPEVAEGFLSTSWNMPVEGALLIPGTSLLIELDTDSGLRPAAGSSLMFPASGVAKTLDIRSLPPFRITFVPIHIIGFATGNVNAANMDYYMSASREVWPIGTADVVVREPYSTNTRSLTDDDWSDLLRETDVLRLAENPSRYYHGILRRQGAWAGLGYLNRRTAITQDGNTTWTVAHELGHNMGRRHAPCGGPSGVDGNYPYSGGGIGVYGLSPDGVTLHAPSRADLMTYCSPRWVSDYSFLGALAFREATGAIAGFATASAPVSSTVLIVSGKVSSSGAKLDPSFMTNSTPSLPESSGPYTIEGRDAAGTAVFSYSFAGEALGDGPSDERHFAFAIPLTGADAAALSRIALRGAGVSDERQSSFAGAPVQSRAADVQSMVAAVASNSGVVAVSWNSSLYPLLVARVPGNGAIIAMARGGSAEIRTTARQLEITLSDGVRSSTGMVEAR
jgi:hypothetical protein